MNVTQNQKIRFEYRCYRLAFTENRYWLLDELFGKKYSGVDWVWSNKYQAKKWVVCVQDIFCKKVWDHAINAPLTQEKCTAVFPNFVLSDL